MIDERRKVYLLWGYQPRLPPASRRRESLRVATPPASSCCCLLAGVTCCNDRDDLPRSMYAPNGCTDGLVGVIFIYQESVRFTTRKMGRSYSCYDRRCTLCLGGDPAKVLHYRVCRPEGRGAKRLEKICELNIELCRWPPGLRLGLLRVSIIHAEEVGMSYSWRPPAHRGYSGPAEPSG